MNNLLKKIVSATLAVMPFAANSGHSNQPIDGGKIVGASVTVHEKSGLIGYRGVLDAENAERLLICHNTPITDSQKDKIPAQHNIDKVKIIFSYESAENGKTNNNVFDYKEGHAVVELQKISATMENIAGTSWEYSSKLEGDKCMNEIEKAQIAAKEAQIAQEKAALKAAPCIGDISDPFAEPVSVDALECEKRTPPSVIASEGQRDTAGQSPFEERSK